MAKQDQTKIAAADAVRTIAEAAAQATKTIANAASEAVKVVNINNNNDHDTLITLVESVANLDRNVNNMFSEIAKKLKDLQDNTTQRITNLESEKLNLKDSYTSIYKKEVEDRLDKIETKAEVQGNIITKIWSYGIAALFVIGLAEFVLSNFFNK